MRYTLKTGKVIVIPDAEIKQNMTALDVSEAEAVEIWLEDNEYEINEEQAALDEKAKKEKVGVEAGKGQRKKIEHRTVKISDEKKAVFDTILENLDRCELIDRENVSILKENKLIQVKIGEKIFKIDVIEQRPPKR